MPIVRPQDVIAQINALYQLPDGPGTIPLDESTGNEIKKILKAIQRLPKELSPTGSSERLFKEAIKVIQDALRKASESPSLPILLQGIQEHQWENPLSILRRTLFWCPDLRPEEVRRRILELAAENERSGSPIDYRDVMAMGSIRNMPLDEIRRHMRILKDEGRATMIESMDGFCSIRLTSDGWKFLEKPAEPSSDSRSLIFISCGQFTEGERQLGEALRQAIHELTPYKGYFAQEQSSLDGLSEHIFGALNQAAGLVAVMHHRGLVKTPYGDHLRASVWVEQEIAIAAFLSQTLGRDLTVILYLQKGITLEGVRQQLMLNPIHFKDSAEVERDFWERLSKGLFQAATSEAQTS